MMGSIITFFGEEFVHRNVERFGLIIGHGKDQDHSHVHHHKTNDTNKDD
jgi:hypothetical protein